MKALAIAVLIFVPSLALATPVLNFSDITSGPKTGNTDGVGSGAIVTVWGNGLGSTQGDSRIYVGNVEATVYYWKDADGTLPSGPADLKTFHRMQEIAFAVPATATDGANTIKVIVGGVTSNTLPFTVRTGGIKFVKPTGNDTTGDGSWSNPYLTLSSVFSGGNGKVSAGDTVYSVGVGTTTGLRIGANAGVIGTAANPIALIAYPNTRMNMSGAGGDNAVVDNYYPSVRLSAYVHLSKLSITAYGNDYNGTGQQPYGITVFPYGRVIATEITGPTVYGGQGGALTGNRPGGRYYGLYIHHYGYQTGWDYVDNAGSWTTPTYDGIAGVSCTNCTSVDSQQHLYYISNRSGAPLDAYEVGWNHIADNPILHGIHVYDQSPGGGWTGTIRIFNNAIKNQRGYSFDAMFPDSTSVECFNNLIITDVAEPYNTGRPFNITGTGPNIKVYNNTVYGYQLPVNITSPAVDIRNNIFVDNRGAAFSAGTPSVQSNNLFYSTSGTAAPAWGTGAVTANPLFTDASAYDFTLQNTSPAKGRGYDTTAVAPVDLLGISRTSSPSIGAFEYGGVLTPTTTRVFNGRLSGSWH